MQEVIAAITTWPSCRRNVSPSTATPSAPGAGIFAFEPARIAATAGPNARAASVRFTRSCGRFGPAREGTTEERSSSKVSVNTGSAVASSRNMPCRLV